MIETTEASQSITTVQCQGHGKTTTIINDARPATVSDAANGDSNGDHIPAGADATSRSFEAQETFYSACLKGQTEVVESLLRKIGNINGRKIENENETPLAAACRMGHLDIVDLLLQNGADADISDENGWTPLHWACSEDEAEVVERLLQVDGLNINAIETKMNQTPLNLSVDRGHVYIVTLLLDRHADLYIKDSMDWTPLMTATGMEHLEIVRIILGHEVGWRDGYLEIPDERNRTPLHIACMQGSCGIASALIKADADCDARFRSSDDDPDDPDFPGYTPLHHACSENQPEIVSLLLPDVPLPGVEVDARAANRRTPLHVACLVGNEAIVKLLLYKKADINATDHQGSTPLHLASGYGPGWRKRTPERDLVKPDGHPFDDSESVKRCWDSQPRNYVSVIEILLRHGADPTMIDEYGCTALHNAAIAVHKGNIEKLLELLPPNALSWGDWKQSPVYSALLGERPLAAMGLLLAKQEIKEAPFWKNGGRLQVIEMAAKMREPFDILGLIFGELASEREIIVAGIEDWGPIQWAAYERLPCVLSKLIHDSNRGGDIDRMVNEALQATSKSITPEELQHKPSCELLVQVVWILITNSQRTRKNMEAIGDAWNIVRNNDTSTHNVGAIPSNRAERREKRQPKLYRRYKESSGCNDDSKVKAKLHPREFEFWETMDSHNKRLERESGVETSKESKDLTILGTLQDILKDPPFAQISQTHRDELDYKPPVPGADTKRIIQMTEATVVSFFKAKGESGRIRRNRPIKEVVYDLGPTEAVGTAIKDLIDMTRRGSMQFNSNLYAKENLRLSWVHLPSTNMVWMNDLLTTIMSHGRYRTRDYYKVRSLFRDSWVEVPDTESRSRMMRPRSVIRPMEETIDLELKDQKTESTASTAKDEEEDGGRGPEVVENEKILADSETEDQKIYDDWNSKSEHLPKKPHGFVPASAIYMPYLSYSTHCRHWGWRLARDDSDLKQKHDHYEDLLDTYKGRDKQQHGSPTLDEWYYQFAQEDNEAINDQSSRNESQVVSKYLRENERKDDMGVEGEPNQWTVVRVNQLWIWTISTDWVITATSSPLGGNPDILVEEILNSLSKQGEYGGSGAQPVSAAELVPAIIDHCIGSYERRPSVSERISIGQTFSHYINRIGRKETTLFDDFRAWSPSEHHQNRNPKENEKPCSPAKRFVKWLDSSTTIESNAQATQTVVQTHSHGHDISAAIQKAKDLYCDIKDVRDELNILKSVAQYQQIVQRGLASKEVDESRFSSTYVVKDLRELDSIAERIQLAINTTLSLQQSEVANRQATEATRQGKTVMTFTFATVLFLPLSFLSSLFALDVSSFQEAPAWAFYIIFFVSIGISAFLGLGVFYWDNVKHAKGNILHIATNTYKHSFKSNLDLRNVSNDTAHNTRRVDKPSILLKTQGPGQDIMSRFRSYARRTKVDDVENDGMGRPQKL